MNLEDSQARDNDSSALFTDSVRLLIKPDQRSGAGGGVGGSRFTLAALQFELFQPPELVQPKAERHHEKPDKFEKGPHTG